MTECLLPVRENFPLVIAPGLIAHVLSIEAGVNSLFHLVITDLVLHVLTLQTWQVSQALPRCQVMHTALLYPSTMVDGIAKPHTSLREPALCIIFTPGVVYWHLEGGLTATKRHPFWICYVHSCHLVSLSPLVNFRGKHDILALGMPVI